MVFFDWDPFEEMRRLQDEMNRLARSLRGDAPLLGEKASKGKDIVPLHDRFRVPVTDLYETDKSVVAQFELPGVDKKDIQLNVTDDAVEVKVEKKVESEEKKKGFYRYESRSSQFYRRLPLPEGMDAAKAEASYKDGVLKVEVPKTARVVSKGRKIEIK